MFKFSLVIPTGSETLPREDFYKWIWSRFSQEGLVGIHEGTVLCEEAMDEGLEADAWMVDSAEAPAGRDWVGHLKEGKAELYFSNRLQAEAAVSFLEQVPKIHVGAVEEQPDQDWDAQWKASFLNAGAGVSIPPFWRIVPPWVEESVFAQEHGIKINPGAGFGTGTHETTQLCLKALGEFLGPSFSASSLLGLDFGSGSGILSIGMACLGLRVDAVEVDPLATDNAKENSQLNGVQDKIRFLSELQDSSRNYSVILANILKPVLLEFAQELVQRLAPQGVLILSGLIEKDVAAVVSRYSQLLGLSVSRVDQQGEWRALIFHK